MQKSKEILELLYKKYGTMILSRKQVCKILGISTATLDRRKAKGEGPVFKKNGNDGSNASVEYSLNSVVHYIVSNDIKLHEDLT